MKILICGSRDWENYQSILNIVKRLLVKYMEFPAEWKKYGRKAGPIRNQQMLDKDPDMVIAFHSDIAKSKGTTDMVRKARKKGVPTYIIRD